LTKTKKTLTDEQHKKLDAIDVIMAARAKGRPMVARPEVEPEFDEGKTLTELGF
jgi:hypothetical protein